MRIVDNSAIGKAAAEIGKPPRVINVYNKKNVSTQFWNSTESENIK